MRWSLVCFVNLTAYVFFTFPSGQFAIGPIYRVMIAMLLAVVVGTMLLFATPLVGMWRIGSGSSM